MVVCVCMEYRKLVPAHNHHYHRTSYSQLRVYIQYLQEFASPYTLQYHQWYHYNHHNHHQLSPPRPAPVSLLGLVLPHLTSHLSLDVSALFLSSLVSPVPGRFHPVTVAVQHSSRSPIPNPYCNPPPFASLGCWLPGTEPKTIVHAMQRRLGPRECGPYTLDC